MKLLNFLNVFVLIILFSCQNTKETPVKTADPNSISIKGSDTELTMVKHLAEEYAKENDSIKISVIGGGSGLGLQSLLKNEIDIANSSREINIHEMEEAKNNNISPTPIMFAVDAIAIITNSRLGVDSLSTKQLEKIFGGEITNWKQLGGPDLKINLYGRDTTSGTYQYLKEKFICKGYSAQMKHLAGNTEIISEVTKDLGGIGYVGVGFLMNEEGRPRGDVWAMPVYIENERAYSPYEVDAVKKGDYVLTRPLYQYINGKPNQKVFAFMMFELSGRGQELVRKFGYFPINNYQKEINRLQGLVTELN
jgi:phosphate transport system substrate-binding protein